MRVILSDSPSWRLFDPRFHTSLAMVYLAAALREAGHSVRIADAHAITSWDGSSMTVHEEMLEPCDVLGISATTANLNFGQQLAAKWPAKVKVLGGRHVTDIMEGRQDRFKAPSSFHGFDYVMMGECEESFVRFCDSNQDIDGCFIVGENQLIPLGKPHSPLPDITKLRTPAFDLWEAGFAQGALMTRRPLGREAGHRPTAGMFNARGCPYGCRFCSDARTAIRMETLEQVEAQCALLRSLGVGAVRIHDDVFTIRERRAMDIADILFDYDIIFRSTTRVNLRNPELFRYLARKGCSELGFGVEHASAKMLKAMDKGTTPEANETAIKMCQDAGIAAQAFLIVGFPGETLETLDEMEEWILRVRPDGIGFSLFQPYPGTDVWNYPERYGVTIPDDCFDRMWQFVEGTEEQMVLDLPTISKTDLLNRGLEMMELIDREIRHRDRRKMAEKAYA